MRGGQMLALLATRAAEPATASAGIRSFGASESHGPTTCGRLGLCQSVLWRGLAPPAHFSHRVRKASTQALLQE